jgi:hypothetical protein
MLKHPLYLLYGLLLVGGAAFAEWRGMGLARPNEVRNVPRTVRDNPGSYRPHYYYIGSRYRRGK